MNAKKIITSSALALAIIGGAGACTTAGRYNHLTDNQAAKAYAGTEYLPAVVNVCAAPFSRTGVDSPSEAYRAGYCAAVTDEPTLALQRWADQGYTDRVAYAVAHGVKLGK